MVTNGRGGSEGREGGREEGRFLHTADHCTQFPLIHSHTTHHHRPNPSFTSSSSSSPPSDGTSPPPHHSMLMTDAEGEEEEGKASKAFGKTQPRISFGLWPMGRNGSSLWSTISFG